MSVYKNNKDGTLTPLAGMPTTRIIAIESAVTSLQTDVTNVKAVIPNNASSSNKLAVQGDVDNIEAVIPSTASSSNKLVTQTDLTTALSNINALLYG